MYGIGQALYDSGHLGDAFPDSGYKQCGSHMY